MLYIIIWISVKETTGEVSYKDPKMMSLGVVEGLSGGKGYLHGILI